MPTSVLATCDYLLQHAERLSFYAALGQKSQISVRRNLEMVYLQTIEP